MNSRATRLAFSAISSAAALAALSFASTAAFADESQTSCDVTLQSAQTDFPEAAQHRGDHGIVQVRVRLNQQGQAEDASVAASSGSAILDHAAVDSIHKKWRFDVARCTASDLLHERIVIVRFEPSKTLTVSGTIDKTAIAKTQELRANPHCNATNANSVTTVFACIDNANQTALASAQASKP